MSHLRLFRSEGMTRAAALYAPILIPYHGAQVTPGMGDLDGLFSKLVKAVAKPFQKVFPAKTALGKLMDPLGLTDPKRNLNLVGRVADVVGTAAAVVAGGWALGAATAGTAGGFWATAGAGAKIAGAKIAAGASWLGGGIGTMAKAAAPLLLSGAFGGSNPAQEGAQIQGPAVPYDQAGMGWDAGTMPASGGGGGGGSWASSPDAMGLPGATVEVTGEAPADGPNWILLGGIALAGVVLLASSKKQKRGNHAR